MRNEPISMSLDITKLVPLFLHPHDYPSVVTDYLILPSLSMVSISSSDFPRVSGT